MEEVEMEEVAMEIVEEVEIEEVEKERRLYKVYFRLFLPSNTFKDNKLSEHDYAIIIIISAFRCRQRLGS